MKRLFLIFSLVCFVASIGFGASAEDLEIYMYLYKNSRTVTDQLGILTALQTMKLTGAGAFYAEALNQLVTQYPTIMRSAPQVEKTAADDLAQTLASLVGEEKFASAAPDLWRTVSDFSSPYVKAEALMSLGKLRAVEYLPQVVRVLADLNAAPPSGREETDSKGHIALGAIIALEKYRDPSGYLPVFFMSVGAYPDRVKAQATKSLTIILEDPSEILTNQVIKSASYAPSFKFQALQTIENANVPSTSKAVAAVASLYEGWKAATNDIRQRMEIGRMRKVSIDMIRRYGTTDPAVYPLLERSYKEGLDEEEKLNSIATLTILASEDSVKLLNSFLMIINGKLQTHSNTRIDETMIRAIIPAIGTAAANISGQGKDNAKIALRSVLSMDWPNAIKTLADDTIKKIPN
jgi:hypothetical protein